MSTFITFYIESRYSANSSIRILELGCGTGYVTEQLSNLFPKAHITAIDFAESMIEVAKTRKKCGKCNVLL